MIIKSYAKDIDELFTQIFGKISVLIIFNILLQKQMTNPLIELNIC